jgi:hypothetical protein
LAAKREKKNPQKVKANAIAVVEPVTPNQLLQLAVETKADVAHLEKLMDLQFKWEANQARKVYVKALSNFRADCPIIPRTLKGYNSNYAGLSETLEHIKGLLSIHGLSHSWRTQQVDQVVSVTCRLTHVEGHYEETSLSAMPDTSGNKNSIQAIGSTVSYLERYTLFALLGLASQDMDDDAQGMDKPTAQQKMIENLIIEAWNNYAEKKAKLLSPGSEIVFEKFKDELRAKYTALGAAEKASFHWTAKDIEHLAETIDVNKVVVKKKNG